MQTASASPNLAPAPSPFGRLLPGLLLCAGLGMVAWYVGGAIPMLGAPVAGLIIGLLVGNIVPLPARVDPGVRFSLRRLLQWAIVGLGLQLPLAQLWTVGRHSLSVTLFTVSIAFIAALLIGRLFGLSRTLSLLIGAGTAICGGSAIAAVAPIVRPKEQELTLALTTIFMFNLAAVFLFPATGHMLHMSDGALGLWAGTAINDTSSVVAAAYSYSHAAGDIATIVKLTRASLILPVTLIISMVVSRGKTGEKTSIFQSFPWFILGFVLAAIVHSMGILPAGVEHVLLVGADFLLVMALVAVGVGSRLSKLVQAGARPVVLGLLVWMIVAMSSLGIMKLQHLW